MEREVVSGRELILRTWIFIIIIWKWYRNETGANWAEHTSVEQSGEEKNRQTFGDTTKSEKSTTNQMNHQRHSVKINGTKSSVHRAGSRGETAAIWSWWTNIYNDWFATLKLQWKRRTTSAETDTLDEMEERKTVVIFHQTLSSASKHTASVLERRHSPVVQ